MDVRDPAGGTGRRLQVAVQVVEGQQLHVLVAAREMTARVTALARARRPRQRGRGQCADGGGTGRESDKAVRTASAALVVRRRSRRSGWHTPPCESAEVVSPSGAA
ncbi:hypothetical protein GCM10027074_41520 [Streptomyces deserti]